MLGSAALIRAAAAAIRAGWHIMAGPFRWHAPDPSDGKPTLSTLLNTLNTLSTLLTHTKKPLTHPIVAIKKL